MQAHKNVLTTATHVLSIFTDSLKEEMPEMLTVYDENLSYETAISQLRSNQNESGNHTGQLPLFAYKRSVMRVAEEKFAGQRLAMNRGCIIIDGKPITYTPFYGEFDIFFLFLANDIRTAEQFEIVYNNRRGISKPSELTLKMPDIGDFKYFFNYNPLEDFQINSQDTYYKAIIGQIVSRGFYFTLEGEASIIKEINARIIESNDIKNKVIGEILNTINIT